MTHNEATAVASHTSAGPPRLSSGNLAQELPMPAHFEQATTLVTEDKVAEAIPGAPIPSGICGRSGVMARSGSTRCT